MTIDKLNQNIAEALNIPLEDLVWKLDQAKFKADLVLVLAPLLSKYHLGIKELQNSLIEVLEDYSDDLSYNFVGAYLNIQLKLEVQINLLIEKLRQANGLGLEYGQAPAKGQLAIVDFIGLNIAKPFSVGHLRPTVQGWAIIQILRNAGYQVIGDNHLGDWGTPFGMWVYAYLHWGSKEAIEKRGVYELNDLYIKFRQALKKKPELIEEAKLILRKLENGDPKVKELYDWFYQLSVKDMDQMLSTLGVKADQTIGESFYQDRANRMVEELLQSGVARKGDGGAVIVELDDQGIETPIMLKKSDGSNLYSTSDLATIDYRLEHWHPDRIIYVVSTEQSFHFNQLFALAKKLGLDQAKLIHAGFGNIDEITDGKRAKISSRKGVILLKDLISQVLEYTKQQFSNDQLSDQDYSKIAIGAIKFADLAQHRKTSILYDFDKMFALNGYSSVYLQYTVVRLRSLINKAGIDTSIKDLSKLDQNAKSVVVELSRFGQVLEDSANELLPHRVSEYLYGLAKEANRLYEHSRVLSEDNLELKRAKLKLFGLSAQVITRGLELLGIEVPDRM
ncbi:arginine--tRNA ligase [Candidatus Saccharibacteria bacterium]|nr:arginine--tRNA ligase [Candidatus Saccharibacteria bacterium]MCB9834669.1 arginine--tRNA ligase [Candidatus Nomurabacteria bacterium]